MRTFKLVTPPTDLYIQAETWFLARAAACRETRLDADEVRLAPVDQALTPNGSTLIVVVGR